MNFFDIILIVVLFVCAVVGLRRGLIRTVYGFVSFAAAVFVSLALYAPITRFLRMTPLYTFLSRGIADALNLEERAGYAVQAGRSLIDVLPLHDFIKETLHINNNEGMHTMLNVTTIQEFIAAFFANLILVAVSLVLIFVLALLVLSFFGKALDVVGRLPVISTFNDVGGLLLGFVFGATIVVTSLFVLSLMFGSGTNERVSNMLDGSMLARFVYENIMPSLFGTVV